MKKGGIEGFLEGNIVGGDSTNLAQSFVDGLINLLSILQRKIVRYPERQTGTPTLHNIRTILRRFRPLPYLLARTSAPFLF